MYKRRNIAENSVKWRVLFRCIRRELTGKALLQAAGPVGGARVSDILNNEHVSIFLLGLDHLPPPTVPVLVSLLRENKGTYHSGRNNRWRNVYD